MALTTFSAQQVSPLASGVPADAGALKLTITNVTGDSAYSVGGSSLTPANLGLAVVLCGQVELFSAPTSGTTNNKSSGGTLVITNGGQTLALKCFTNGSGAASINSVENAANDNLSGLIFQVFAFGY